MPTVLLPADILQLNQILIAGGAKQFYSVLEAKGYGYPLWALGVASSMGMPAIAAADYLRGTALMGISSAIFQILNPSQVDKLRFDIAKSYLRILHRLSRQDAGAGIRRDVNVDEVWKLHAEGLERNGLSIENWNLYFPLAILKRLAGQEVLERFWAFLRDVRRRPSHVSILACLATLAFMYKQTMSGDIKCRQMASAWLSRNPGMYTCAEIERKLEASLKSLDRASQGDVVHFLDLLDLEAHGLGQTADSDLAEGDSDRRGADSPLAWSAWVERSSDALPWDGDADSAAVYRSLLKRLTS